MLESDDQIQNPPEVGTVVPSAVQSMALYRRNKKHRLREWKAQALATLGIGPHDPIINLVWDVQLNEQAAVGMLEILRDLQENMPDQAARIAERLEEIGIPGGGKVEGYIPK